MRCLALRQRSPESLRKVRTGSPGEGKPINQIVPISIEHLALERGNSEYDGQWNLDATISLAAQQRNIDRGHTAYDRLDQVTECFRTLSNAVEELVNDML